MLPVKRFEIKIFRIIIVNGDAKPCKLFYEVIIVHNQTAWLKF